MVEENEVLRENHLSNILKFPAPRVRIETRTFSAVEKSINTEARLVWVHWKFQSIKSVLIDYHSMLLVFSIELYHIMSS